MGVKRGAFETQSLGDVAKSAKGASVQINSIQPGLSAYAEGVKAYGKSFLAIADGLGDFAKFFGKMADHISDSRNAVRQNDLQEQSAAKDYEDIVVREGKDSENAQHALSRLRAIQDQRSTLGFMTFGEDPAPDYKKYQPKDGGR